MFDFPDSHVSYYIWVDPYPNEEGGGGGGLEPHFQEKQPQVLDFRCATPLPLSLR